MRPRTFLYSLLNSITSPSYYIDILNAPLSFSLRFFFWSYVLITILATAIFYVVDIPYYKAQSEAAFVQLETHFPQALKITWDGTQLQTNTPQPILVSYPSFLELTELPKHMIAVAPSAESPQQFLEKSPEKALTVVTAKQLHVPSSLPLQAAQWNTYELRSLPGFNAPFEITKSSLASYFPHWREWVDQGLTLLKIAFPILFLLLMPLIRILTTFLEVVLLYYLFWALGKSLPFIKFAQIGLHIAVVAELVNVITAGFITTPLDMFSTTFWVYFLFLSFQLWNVKEVSLTRKPKKE